MPEQWHALRRHSHKHRYSPHLLITLVPASARYLPQTEHRKLFDKVAAFFARYHRVHLPYRVTFKMPLLNPLAKRLLRAAFDSLFLRADHWPLFLQRYLLGAAPSRGWVAGRLWKPPPPPPGWLAGWRAPGKHSKYVVYH